MNATTVKDLLSVTGGSLISGRPQTVFRQVSIDTRTLLPGNAFFALRGPRFDGHHFLRAAADRGAAVIVIDQLDERLYLAEKRPADVVLVKDSLSALQAFASACRRRARAKVIGITGSNGKTTTKEMLACILRQAGKTLATRGNFNNHIGLPLMCCEIEDETEYIVLEMGTSKKGDMVLLVDVARPDIGLMTNVGKDHLEFLMTPEGVLEENRLLYDRLPSNGVAIINLDDPLLEPLVKQLHIRTFTYSLAREDADIFARNVHAWPLPLRFELWIEGEGHEATISVPGTFQVSNALAAAAAARSIGFSPSQILEGLRRFKPIAMRMQMQRGKQGSVFVNDAYNANPSSVRVSVEGFCKSFTDQGRWLVLGDMRELGSNARHEHEALGEWLATQALDRIFLYGRDTRFVLEGLQRAKSKTPIERFKKKKFLTRRLEEALSVEKPAILFKASRSLRLEEALTPLLAASESAVTAH